MEHELVNRTIFLWGALAASWINAQQSATFDNSIQFDPMAVFDEVSQHVQQHFYPSDFDIQDWQRKTPSYRQRCQNVSSHDQFSEIVNDLLRTLKASHTYYFSKLDPKRFQLVGIFSPLFEDQQASFFQYDGIGIDTISRAGKHYVIAAYDGFPGKASGLQYGDQISSVDGQPFHPILSFAGKSECKIKVARDASELVLTVPVEKIDGRFMFETAMESSVKVFNRQGKSIGYLHVWSYAGSKYQEILREQILWGKLKDCDALVVDLRDGWGGADINYLNLFRKPIAKIETSSRAAGSRNYSGVWGKPVNLLINQRSTSGKELFAYGFKKLNLGKVIGSRSAGAVVAGRCFPLSNGDVLYLAVRDVKVDGQRLEHVGVEPDVLVERPLNSEGASDPPLQRAMELLLPVPANSGK